MICEYVCTTYIAAMLVHNFFQTKLLLISYIIPDMFRTFEIDVGLGVLSVIC